MIRIVIRPAIHPDPAQRASAGGASTAPGGVVVAVPFGQSIGGSL